MKLIAYQKGDRRIMARVLDNKALPFANLEDFWADPAAESIGSCPGAIRRRVDCRLGSSSATARHGPRALRGSELPRPRPGSTL